MDYQDKSIFKQVAYALLLKDMPQYRHSKLKCWQEVSQPAQIKIPPTTTTSINLFESDNTILSVVMIY